MLDVIREPKEPPRSAFVTASGIASGLVGFGAGIPTIRVDCAAPGRSVTSKTRCGFTFGLLIIGSAPLLHPANVVATAFSISPAPNPPATYTRAPAPPNLPA